MCCGFARLWYLSLVMENPTENTTEVTKPTLREKFTAITNEVKGKLDIVNDLLTDDEARKDMDLDELSEHMQARKRLTNLLANMERAVKQKII